jgi:hypothetical protein
MPARAYASHVPKLHIVELALEFCVLRSMRVGTASRMSQHGVRNPMASAFACDGRHRFARKFQLQRFATLGVMLGQQLEHHIS